MASTDPFTSAFELQRNVVEQTHQASLEALEAQKTAVTAAADGVDTSQQIAEQSTRLGREAVHGYLDAIERVDPEADLSELRALVDDGFEDAEELQAESWGAIQEAVDESVEGFETAADNYGELVDTTFDTFLSAHEQVEENVDDFEEIDVSAD